MCTFSVQKWKALIDVIVSFVVEFLARGWLDDTSYLDESNQRNETTKNELLNQLEYLKTDNSNKNRISFCMGCNKIQFGIEN